MTCDRPIPGTRSRDRDTGWRAGVAYNAAVAGHRLSLNSQERRFALSERQTVVAALAELMVRRCTRPASLPFG
jgi:hypothetical protein